MNINISISPAPSITDKIAVVIYKASSPGVIADSQEFNPPHTSPRNITFTNVDPESYIVNTYETTGLPTLGTLRHSFIYDPSFIGAEIKPTEFLYMVGGATSYTDTSWIGWDIESIERVGLGTQFESDSPDTTVAKNISLRTDGFDLEQAGDSFGGNEKWVVRFYPKITTFSPVVRSAKIIRDFLTLDSDTTLTDAEAGISISLKGASSHFTVTLPEIITLENALMYCFISDGGQHIGVTIQRTGTTDVFDLRGSKTYLEIVQGDRLWVCNDNATNKWIVIKEPHSAFVRGVVFDIYDKPVNAYDAPWVFADGAELDRTIYKGLFDYYTALPSSAKTTKAAWDASVTEQGKWHSGDGSTTFGTPRLYAKGFLKAVNGSTRLPGSYEADQVGEFELEAVQVKLAGGGGIVTLLKEYGLPGAFVNGPDNQTYFTGEKTMVENTGIYKCIYI